MSTTVMQLNCLPLQKLLKTAKQRTTITLNVDHEPLNLKHVLG